MPEEVSIIQHGLSRTGARSPLWQSIARDRCIRSCCMFRSACCKPGAVVEDSQASEHKQNDYNATPAPHVLGKPHVMLQ